MFLCVCMYAQALLAARADVNLENANKFKSVPLTAAAEEGRAFMVELLLDAKADANHEVMDVFTKTPSTALRAAVECPSAPCVRVLLERGANVSSVLNLVMASDMDGPLRPDERQYQECLSLLEGARV